MKVNNKYGYKLCYRANNKRKLKIHKITNTLDLALFEIQRNKYVKIFNRHSKTKLINPVWHLLEVKNKKEYNKLYKGCPFKDDL